MERQEYSEYTRVCVKDALGLDDKKVELHCRVVGVRPSGEFWIVLLKDASGMITAVSREHVEEGRFVFVRGRVYRRRDSAQIGVDSFEYTDEKVVEKNAVVKKVDFLYTEMEIMREDVERMAGHLIKVGNSGKKIVVKYDCDADGLSGALIIYRMFKCLGVEGCTFAPADSPVYRVEDGLRDSMHYGHDTHYIFLDFGNNNESREGLEILRMNSESIAIIDHHLSERKRGSELVVTPVWHGLGYEYTTGLLCYEIARRVCDCDYGNMWKASLYCDKSTLEYEHSNEIEEIGLVLDYIATTARKERHSISFTNELMDNKEMLHEIYISASNRIEDALNAAVKIAKTKELGNGITVVLVNVDKVAEKGSFPNKGKVTGKVHDTFVGIKAGPVVTIGYGTDSAMLRANRMTLEKGFNANSIIQEIKGMYEGYIISGGGHPGAAAIRFRKGFKKAVLNALLEKICSV
ncbi:MAG: DHH family phosphoesterase [Candidatus Micrarchaeia archaeon]